MEIIVKANTRKMQGTGASRRLRIAEKVPGILYGAEKAATPIELEHNALYHQLRQEAFHASILTMELDGKNEKVLLRDVQRHPFREIVLHVDFQRIDAAKKIHMKVPFHFKNAEICPGVKISSGIVSHVINEVNISCLPADLPEFIEVDLANLAAGHSLHLSQIPPPKGVEFVQINKKEDPPVATIIIPRAVASEEAAEATATAAADVPAAKQKEKEAAPAAAAGKDAKKDDKKEDKKDDKKK
ncbi:MAG: 50S ribosomal protein L25/general stress protein Ctc [Burkholderiales bacterium]